ncbi:MAG TPA: sugar phosphate isomerase/epimerase [Rariglobus sp.]|jgi:sugar phosphate isomerase/epimerase|nr:sugar phosphate isomerase/epimerase [Rariglobus sp.]
MKSVSPLCLVFTALFAFSGCRSTPQNGLINVPVEVKPLLGLQAYTFRSFTFAQTLEKAHRLGIHYIQAYPGQNLGGGLDGKFHHTMDAATQAKVLALLKDADVKLVSYGVVNAGNMDEWRQIFTFAKAMGMDNIATEAPAETLAKIDPISREFGIAISLHNHPTPSIYANLDTALAAIKPFGANVGLCADTGHWVRSGYDAVENLHRAEGHIIAVHFKDLNQVNLKSAHDVPWGTGASQAAGQLAELRRQHFGGVVLIEYEHNNADLEKNVALSVQYFNRAMAAPLADLVEGKVIPPGYTRTPEQLWGHGRGKDSKRWPNPPAPAPGANAAP